jgi:hypothetical protein
MLGNIPNVKKMTTMKRIIAGLLLIAGIGTTAMAQVIPASNTEPVYNTTSSPANPDYNTNVTPMTTSTFVIPVYTEQTFRTTYPNASRTTWYRVSDDWYRVGYMDNGPWIFLGYNTRGESYPISLPVLQTAVPDDVVTAVMNRFGGVYDITETVGSDLQTQYMVRTLDENGTLSTHLVNASAMDLNQ